MNPSKQTGVAIIMVLLIVALATSLASYMAQQQNLWLRQVESQFDRAQARRIGIAGIDWARAILADDARTNSSDHEQEMWALRLPAMPVENGEVIGMVEDRQGLFNLNNLVRNGTTSAADVAQFQRLLALLGLPADLAITLSDWMDTDLEVQAGGGEDEYYLALTPPYRAANRPLSELGEVVRIKGFNGNIMERLQPFVSVLPVAGPVNVNFAPPEVLAAIIPGLSLSDARSLVEQRRGKPFNTKKDFMDLPLITTLTKNMKQNEASDLDQNIAISSQFFWVTGRASVGQAQVTTHALLQRSSGWPSVVWQRVQ